MEPVVFHRHEDLMVEFPKRRGGSPGGSGHHEHDGMPRHFHYVSGERIDWRDAEGKDHSTGWWRPGQPIDGNPDTPEPPVKSS